MRYLPKSDSERREMLDACGVSSPEELFAHLPEAVRLNRPLNLAPGISEYEIVRLLPRPRGGECANGYACFLGAGVYNHYRPVLVDTVVSRGEFLTSYTPYQAEISQGTLTTIFEFQTMICQLTGMDVANASMYDGSTAVPEAAMMAVRATGQGPRAGRADACIRNTAKCCDTYAKHQGMPVDEFGYDAETGSVDLEDLERKIDDQTAAVIIQIAQLLRHRRAGEGGGGDRAQARRAAGGRVHRSRVAGIAGAAARRRYRRRRAAVLRDFAELRRTVRRHHRDARKSSSGRCRAGWWARRKIRAAIAPSA